MTFYIVYYFALNRGACKLTQYENCSILVRRLGFVDSAIIFSNDFEISVIKQARSLGDLVTESAF